MHQEHIAMVLYANLSDLHSSLNNIGVTEDGEVYNKKTGRNLKQYIRKINGSDYYMVSIYCKDKKYSKPFYVHRLVGYAYCEGYDDGMVINHKDGNTLNNNPSNLEWKRKKEKTIQIPTEYIDEIVHLENGMTIMPTTEWDRIQKYIKILLNSVRYNNV